MATTERTKENIHAVQQGATTFYLTKKEFRQKNLRDFYDVSRRSIYNALERNLITSEKASRDLGFLEQRIQKSIEAGDL